MKERNYKKYYVILSILTLLHFNIYALGNYKKSVEEEIELDEYTVYNEIIKQKFVSKEQKIVIIVRNTVAEDSKDTSKESLYSYLKGKFKSLKDITPDLIDSYEKRNQQSAFMFSRFSFGLDYKLLSNNDLAELEDAGRHYWEFFEQKYPNSSGIISFSRVGFNVTNTKAFLFASIHCGLLCGKGDYYFLEKQGNSWKIKANVELWVS